MPRRLENVQRPLHLGGLGVADISLCGLALRLHWIWLKRKDPSRSWASLPIREESVAASFFRASTRIELGDGRSVLF